MAQNYLKPDRGAGFEIQDYKDGLAERTPEVESDELAGGGGSIPPLQRYISSVPDGLKPMPLVSISVNQSVPLRDILFELAQQADYDLELDPKIRGSIIFTAREKPFDLVIERIADVAGLRYSFNDETLRVELDTPYNQTYKIDYLSYIRTSSGSIRNNIAVVSGEGADTGSTFEATSESESDFWGELETGITQILGDGTVGSLRTSSDPFITATEQNPDVVPLMPGGADGITVQPPDAILRVDSLPVDGGGGEGEAVPQPATLSINKQAGVINVFAPEKVQEEIDAYLNLVRRSVTAQVLIEAKILEVTLNDEFVAGIDWRAMSLFSGEGVLNFSTGGFGSLDTLASGAGAGLVPLSGAATIADASSFVVGFAGNDVQALIHAISGFGTVRALASPRLTVLNNQSAVLNVATNRVFFEVDIDVTTDDGVTQTDIDSDIRNVPEGVLVNVQPSISLDTGTVSMAVRPTITNIIRSIPDPAIQFVTASAGITGVVSNIPEVNVQEIDSVIQVRSGQPIVMGGLLQDSTTNEQESVPVLGEIPMVGSLFRSQADLVKKTELVIFLKATILESPADSIHNTDRDLYRMFSGDRRPLKL